jgi:hypothetical protein
LGDGADLGHARRGAQGVGEAIDGGQTIVLEE